MFNSRLSGYVTKAQLDVLIIFKGWNIEPRTLDEIRRANPRVILVNYNPDDPLSAVLKGSSNERIRACIPKYDLYLTFSETIAKGLRNAGSEAVCAIPFGYVESTMYIADNVAAGESGRFLMYGAWDPDRQALVGRLGDFPLDVHGNGWIGSRQKCGPIHTIGGKNLYGQELRSKVRAAIGVINPLRHQNRMSHNMRTYEVAAMGGLQLAPATEEHVSLFGRSGALLYRSEDELRALMQEVVRSPTAFEHVRSEGARVMRGHSYRDRAKCIVDMLKSIDGDRRRHGDSPD